MKKNLYNRIAKTSILAILLFVSQSCGVPKVALSNLSIVKVSAHFEFVKIDDGKMIIENDSLNIIYWKKYIVYQLPSLKTYSKVTMDKNLNIISDKILKEETTYSYFIYRKNKQSGYLFDSITVTKPHIGSVDSFLVKKAYKHFPFYLNGVDSLVETTVEPNDQTKVEKFVCYNKKDDSYFDTTYYYYNSKYKNLDYSFSKYLDSTRHAKMYKVLFIYNPTIQGKTIIPRRKFIFEIKDCKQIEKQQAVKFIEQFKSKEKELYPGN